MSELFFTSDLHLGHRTVAKIREFHDGEGGALTEEHDEWLADCWDSVLKPEDHIFVLGDISMGGGQAQAALDWIEQRPGIKHLVAGNHDDVHPMDRRAPNNLPHWLKYFQTIQPFYRRKMGGINYLMSHLPYESWGEGPLRGGSVASRYNQYRLPELGLPLLHGHTHGPEKAHGNMFHVGVDAWDGHPVHHTTVADWLYSNFDEDKPKHV